mmetsp:Transcript_33266/g.83371  ORF Transcript_33266/g.83371 Transcript_33266/m.83371 type:complete len:228 (+) Transcript_33266:146-829(+)
MPGGFEFEGACRRWRSCKPTRGSAVPWCTGGGSLLEGAAAEPPVSVLSRCGGASRVIPHAGPPAGELHGRQHPVRHELPLALDGDLAAALQRQLAARALQQQCGGALAAVDHVGLRVALHARGCIHRVAKQAVARVELAHDGRHHRPRVEAHPDVDVAERGVVLLDEHRVGGFDGGDGELRDAQRVVRLLRREVGHCHVGVPDRLHLGPSGGGNIMSVSAECMVCVP